MEIKPVLEAPAPAAGLDPGIRDTLPPLVMGERPEISPEHAWPATLFYTLSYLVAAGLGLGACVSAGAAVLGLGRPPVEMLGQAAVMGAGAAFQWWLAKEVQDFTRWGWYGAMVELAAAAAAKLWAIADGNPVGGAIGLGIDLMWIDHFWKNRGQYDVDLGG